MENLQGNVMTLIDGYENESGVFLRYIETKDETVFMDNRYYNPQNEDFAWAIQQLKSIEA